MSQATAGINFPLISVICRTVNRPSLQETLASVARQSWPNIELVLVDALGRGLSTPAALPDTIHIKIVSTGSKLDRPQAANAGIDAASGEFLLFLDDDDWISPDHLSKLHAAIQQHPAIHVVYSATQKTRDNGQAFDELIAVPFDRTVLRRDNFIPIHAALFSRRLLELGCRFDETLPVYEDWDFWLQCSTHSDFLLHEHVGAFYRMGGDSETMLKIYQQRYEPGHPTAEARALLLDKWRHVWTGKEWNALIGLIDQTPALTALHDDLVSSHKLLEDKDQTILLIQEDYQELQADHIALNLAHEELDRGVKEVLNSFSWRVTAPYRWAAFRTRQWLAQKGFKKSGAGYQINTDQTRDNTQNNQQPSSHHSGPVQAGIVVPTQNNLMFTDAITVQAWAWASSSLRRVEILLDGISLHQIEPVPSHTDLSEAQRIGFARLIDTTPLVPGSHKLVLQVEDAEGTQLELSRTFVYQQPEHYYGRWLKNHHASIERSLLSARPASAACEFLVAIFLPVRADIDHDDSYQDKLNQLELTLQSLKQQSAANWHCVMVGDARQHGLKDSLEVILSSTDISAELIDCADVSNLLDLSDNQAKQIAVLLEPGDVLQQHCLRRIQQSWQHNTQLVYCDHDQLDHRQRAHSPVFCFDWSPDLLLSRHYIGDVYFADAKQLAGLPLKADSPAWRYALLLQLTQRLDTDSIQRVQEVLWSQTEHSAIDLNTILAAQESVVQKHLADIGIAADVGTITNTSCRYIRRHFAASAPATRPLVSIIIPTTAKMQFLQPCLDTLKTSSYPAIEVIVLDNGRGQYPEGIEFARNSGAKVIECNEAFNWSRLNNIGVEHSNGELLLFLNDDIEIIQADWLEALVEQALRDDVGTVGCLLLYPNGAIQHGGVFLVDHGGGARHLFHKQLPGRGIYLELDQCIREVSASTGACLMVRRDRFRQLNGFDEKLSVVGNDIDLCLRAREAGLKNIWTPFSRLIHHESVSRQSKPIGQDEKSMWSRWGKIFRAGDPCYNRNLSLTREDCALAEAVPTISASHRPVAPQTTDETSSTASPGVNLIAYIRASMGVGEAARGNAAALEASGAPYGIINYERGNPSRMDNLRWQHKEIDTPLYDINLLHINADHIPAVMKDLGSSWFRNRYNIGFWAWEMPEFPDRWLSSFDLLDEIWVPSSYVNQAVAAKSPVPVITIPHVINVDMTGACQYPRAFFGIAEQAFVFVSLFDTHSIAQRKNPFGSILAFQKAFAANDASAQLVIKINNADEANLKVVHDCIGDWKNIVVIDQHMDRAQIDSLINCSDCYVSLHHAEGFGLGPAEAMAMGKVALLTGWSGNTEYMRNNNCIPVHYKLKSLGKDYGPYEAHQYWAVPDINHAAAEMKDLAANPDRARALGEQARLTIAQEFSAEAIGKRMKTRLLSIERIRSKQKRH